MNEKNLRPCTPENARERQLKSAQKRKENNEKKKLLSEMYAEFLSDEYKVRKDGEEIKISGTDYIKTIIKAVVSRGDSSSVAMLKEIREATEGQKINLNGEVKAEMQTTEERLKIFDELIGGK
jgi:hypothetical protein